jgi:glyoxylase-like metal-dependent hydrolase (beta-lactamase superfamily II)
MEPEQAVPEQLRARGVNPADVRLVVMTHLHYDHASGMGQFPNARFVLTGWEWDAANGPFSLLHGYVRRHFLRPVDYLTLDFDSEHATSYGTFGRSLDLLGDGSLRAIFTPGHTHGHMSMILRTAGVEILVAADAVYTRHTLETGHLPAHMEDDHLFKRSLREIQIYHRQHPDVLVIPGHDMEAWRELAPLYE